ncbi:MAG: biopolymer transporter ExbD [Spirochaetia bacterium]|nr:biopolymer transporter ExbD [Spirochaetia bacterium]
MKSRLKIKTGVEMVAVADVVFLLLTYFLLNTTVGKNETIKISLPKSISSKPEASSNIIVHVDESNKIFLDGKPVELEDLGSALKGKIKGTEESPVIIKGDKSASYQTVISVMDKINQAGITNFNLATEK